MRYAMIVLLATLWPAAADSGWSEDFAASLLRAEKEKKYMLVNFTGSDWCSLCQRLKKEVFADPEFLTLVRDRFVLVELDFPWKVTQPEPLKSQNRELMKKFKVRAFPTVFVLDSRGQTVGEVKAVAEGTGPFLAALRELAK